MCCTPHHTHARRLRDSDTKGADANKAAAAGAIVVLVANFLFALIFARDPVTPAPDAAQAVKA